MYNGTIIIYNIASRGRVGGVLYFIFMAATNEYVEHGSFFETDSDWPFFTGAF